MNSMIDFANRIGLCAYPISATSIVRKFGVKSIREAVAAWKIKEFHRRTGADYGPLGIPLGKLTKAENGSYQQEMQLGSIRLTDFEATPTGETNYIAEVTLSAVRCFGTQDSSTDETYAVISLFSINPNHGGTDVLVKTMRTEILDVQSGDTIFKMRTIGAFIPAGGGIGIHIAIWDHESGDADEIKNKTAAVLNDSVNKAVTALSAAAVADDPSISAGNIGKVTDFEVGGIKPFQILTAGLANEIAKMLADDLIGEHLFFIPAENIRYLANQTNFNASIRRSPDLPFDVQVNWPPPGEEPLLTDGNGTYKAYFLIKGGMVTLPVQPRIQ